MAAVVTSETDICNIALSLISTVEITDLDEASKEGRLCKRHYGRIRDAVLRAHPWNFAVKRVELAQDSETPSHEYAFYYTLPSDYLRLVRTGYEACGNQDDYRIENSGNGIAIATDRESVFIEYVARITDVTKFDALFVDAVSARLAAELCLPIMDNAASAERLQAVYRDKLAEARTIDAQEGTPRADHQDVWLEARL